MYGPGVYGRVLAPPLQRAIELREPARGDRGRIEAMVRATGLFREEEVGIALEVFDGSILGADRAEEAERAEGQVSKNASQSGPSASSASSASSAYASIGAYDNDVLIGWIAFGRRPCTDGTYDCYWIVVDPARHRAGIGTLLIEAMESRLGSMARLIVAETSGRSDYAPTRAFYERVGYRAQSRIPDFYSDGDDLVVFVKYLSPAVRP